MITKESRLVAFQCIEEGLLLIQQA